MDVDLEDLAFDQGGALIVKRALRLARTEQVVTVAGSHPDLGTHLRAWCRAAGNGFEWVQDSKGGHARIVRGPSEDQRWSGAERAGSAHPHQAHAVLERPSKRWGLAGRSALIEAGSPEFHFPLDRKAEVWSSDAGRMYAQGAAAQWDPAAAVPWDAEFDLPVDVDAVVQIMTYLIENETAALIVPSRFLAQMHPHFREVMQVLAVQAADEARHIEVFTRRALLKRRELGLSTAGGQQSLQTLVTEPDFAIASFLLSVLGEGTTFLSLLWFLERYAPDRVTAAVCRLAAQDEARHVAFGMSHLREHLQAEPSMRETLINAVRRRHEALRHTAGLNAEVFDSLVLLAAGSWDPADIRRGQDAVTALLHEMHASRKERIRKLGFSDADAEEMSALHTRNFM